MVGSWEEGKCGQRHAVISSFHDANEATPGTISTTLRNSPTFQGGPLALSFALASKLLSAILTNLPFSPKSPALQGGPLVFSFALASKLLSAILTNLPFLPDSPNSPALLGGPLLFSFALASKLLLAKFCHFCHFCCCEHFWTYLNFPYKSF